MKGNLMSYYKSFVLILLLSFSHSLFANPTLFHFENSQGHEISGYAYEHTYSDVRYTLFAKQGADATSLVMEFAQAVMEGRTYFYDTATCPTQDCHVGYRSENFADTNKQSAAKGSRKNFNKNDAPNRVLENIATEVGNRVVGNVVDRWFENTDAESSPLNVLYDNSSGAPIGMCVMTSSGCEFLSSEDVLFANLDNGWTVTYNYPDTTQPDYRANANIADAIERFIRYSQRTRKLSCRTVFTGSGDDLKPQVICYYSY